MTGADSALVPTTRGAKIAAFLLDSEELPDHWDRLDEFEGEGYRRILVPFFDDDGRRVIGQVYADRDQPRADEDG